ncbi:hypothetical protein L1889_18105 [Paenalcaligenes niemegkensis]|uniref:hypothetical protein n=1 Tax=Paenalcaligenes niemegkensis TaxID=2895469 RepID=UPI001EE88DB1|nr:hypothetical protein [Paenalcaligenes niemegkensis]MCQ9618354.1 hypothetical protein [Paenalcaligenes niemegkensis]
MVIWWSRLPPGDHTFLHQSAGHVIGFPFPGLLSRLYVLVTSSSAAPAAVHRLLLCAFYRLTAGCCLPRALAHEVHALEVVSPRCSLMAPDAIPALPCSKVSAPRFAPSPVPAGLLLIT